MLVPGATELNGWPGLPYGQLGKGPVPASWQAVIDVGAMDEENIEILMDLMLNLREGFTSPALLGGGHLRPLARAMSATLVMYYGESVAAQEVLVVTHAMREAMVAAKLAKIL